MKIIRPTVRPEEAPSGAVSEGVLAFRTTLKLMTLSLTLPHFAGEGINRRASPISNKRKPGK
jgi:hypothetical protein